MAYIGTGHSTDITKVRISPNNAQVVTVSADGAIFQWDMPKPSPPSTAPAAQV